MSNGNVWTPEGLGLPTPIVHNNTESTNTITHTVGCTKMATTLKWVLAASCLRLLLFNLQSLTCKIV